MKIWETKAEEGGKTVLVSVLFLCKKHVWDDIRRKDSFVLFPFSQHFSVLSHLLLLLHIACFLAELLVEGCFPDKRSSVVNIPRYNDTLQSHKSAKSSTNHRGSQTVIQIISTSGSFPSRWDCTGFVLAPGTTDCGLRFVLSLLS